MQNLPDNLYSVDSIVRLEQVAINQFGIPAYELMKRAGDAVFQVLTTKYPQHNKLLVLCGAGNNAGDGYVVGRLARQAGLDVSVISLIDPAVLKNEAQLAYQDWCGVAENSTADLSSIDEADIVIDALLGTGLTRAISAEWLNWIDAINKSNKPVISVDVPSGLLADTGAIAGSAIYSDVTVSFIGLKQGMFTAQANDVCGEIIFEDLAIPDEAYSLVEPDARLIKAIDYSLLPKRESSSHKGKFGHVLIVGGNESMPGAVILAAKAALRTGAGLVTVLTIAENLQAISSAVPEVMVKSCEAGGSLADTLTASLRDSVTHIAIGMGLGRDDWALEVLRFCVQLNKTMVVDADALNLIAQHGVSIKSSLLITPHPGEAARLLSDDTILTSKNIQNDRFTAVKKLYNMFADSESCIVVLKGSGTLIFDGKTLKVCSLGNAAMAAPGMGDVLSGILVALSAQGIANNDAAELAVCLHASAAERLAKGATRGLLASDLIDVLPALLQ